MGLVKVSKESLLSWSSENTQTVQGENTKFERRLQGNVTTRANSVATKEVLAHFTKNLIEC